MYILDTNILIHFTAGDQKIKQFLQDNKHDIIYIPSIAIVEFLAFPLITPETVSQFKQFTAQTIILNLDFWIAEIAAELKRRNGLKLADAVIGSSAIASGSTLVTRNVRDFKKIKGLKLVEI